MKYTLTIFIYCILLGTRLYAQDPVLSQAYTAAQFLSPASVGAGMYEHRVQGNLRSQFMNGNSMYKTNVVGWDTRFKNKSVQGSNNFLAMGLQLMSDQLGGGLLNTTYLTVNTAYHMSLDKENKSNLSVGMGGTLAQTYINKDKLRFGDQFDGMGNFNGSIVSADYSNLRPSPLKFAGNIGVLYAYHSEESFFQIAANAFYYGRPDNVSTGINQADGVRAGFFTNIEKYLTEDYTFILHGSYNNRNNLQQTLVGGSIGIPFLYRSENVNRIYAGCFVRIGDAIIPTLSLMMDKYTFGISYDVYSNALSRANLRLNGFELSFSTGFGKKRANVFRTLLN
ncbi:MAG: PorP/SprF family type IX secretion system membrane protein [Chitinophagaceae bacterium]